MMRAGMDENFGADSTARRRAAGRTPYALRGRVSRFAPGNARTRSRGRRTAALAALLAIFAPSVLPAIDWPVRPPAVLRTFGTPREGYPGRGIVLGSETPLVAAGGEGTVVFAQYAGYGPDGFPAMLGNAVAIAYSGGITGLFSGLGSIDPIAAPSSGAPGKVGKDTVIGAGAQNGSGGYTSGFAVYDSMTRAWVNPLLVLPETREPGIPSISGLSLVAGTKEYALGNGRGVRNAVPQGDYTIVASVADPAGGVQGRAPYAARLLADGIEIGSILFDVANSVPGGLSFFGRPAPSSSTLDMEGRFIIAKSPVLRGKVRLELVVRNFSGIERRVSWDLDVR